MDAMVESSSESLAFRLSAEDFNDHKHRAPLCEETFAFPGTVVDGQRIIGNIMTLPFSASSDMTIEP